MQLRGELRQNPNLLLDDSFRSFQTVLLASTKHAGPGPEAETPAASFTTSQAKAITDYVVNHFFKHYRAHQTCLDSSFLPYRTQYIQSLYISSMVPDGYTLNDAAEVPLDSSIDRLKYEFEATYDRNIIENIPAGQSKPMNPEIFEILQSHMTAAQEQTANLLAEIEEDYQAKIKVLQEKKQVNDTMPTKHFRRPISSHKK
jgi:hypothetical protein